MAASPNNSVTVVIADNDLAAGRVALAASSQSAIVSEGMQCVLAHIFQTQRSTDIILELMLVTSFRPLGPLASGTRLYLLTCLVFPLHASF